MVLLTTRAKVNVEANYGEFGPAYIRIRFHYLCQS